jgi:hypothetical protein
MTRAIVISEGSLRKDRDLFEALRNRDERLKDLLLSEQGVFKLWCHFRKSVCALEIPEHD